MPRKNKLTFFTPTMDRTGSEITLFNLLCRINNQFKAVVISKYKGSLLDRLPSTVEGKFLYKTFVKFKLPIRSYTLTKLSEDYYAKIVFYLKTLKYRNTVWYINTITLHEDIEYAEKHGIKVIVHVHEREPFFEKLKKDELRRLINYPSLIIACSDTTANILAKYGRTNGVETCNSSINAKEVYKDKAAYASFRKELGIGENSFLWVMSGSMDKNKNPRLFVDVAYEVLKAYPNAFFMWIGGRKNELLEECKRMAAELGLTEKILWIGNKGTDYYKYFNCADGFVLTSIMESFPLVTLEALLFGLPIVAYDCGGVREILQDDIGQIINEESPVQPMAQAMISYMTGKLTYDADKERQRAEKFDIEAGATKWNQILNNFYK